MYAPHDAGRAAPCLDCGSTGGYTLAGRQRPLRVRGLCETCRARHAYQGTIRRYPLSERAQPCHPVIPRQYIAPAQLGIRPGQHAVIPGYDWEAVCREALAYCWAWLATHPEQAQAVAA